MSRRSIKELELRPISEINRIQYIIYQTGLERGETSAKKVFQVLELWKKEGWILAYEENPRWRYYDYILHQDGWFMTLDSETVNFQIKSSQRAAQKHLKKYSSVRVIVVRSGVSLDGLNREMQKLFKDKLPIYLAENIKGR